MIIRTVSRLRKQVLAVVVVFLFEMNSAAVPQRAAKAAPQQNQGQAQGQARANAHRPAPIRVSLVRGKYCGFYAPQGWFVAAEDAERIAFGTDFSSGDRYAAASYSIFGAGRTISRSLPGHETVERAVITAVTLNGRQPARFGNKVQLGSNLFAVEYLGQTSHGIAFYEVFPSGPGDYTIVLRLATTAPSNWQQRGSEAVAIARSAICHVPNVPPASVPSALTNPPKRLSSGGSENKDEDSLYNAMRDKEYYHDAQGNNYWVSPSEDWHKAGPDGEG